MRVATAFLFFKAIYEAASLSTTTAFSETNTNPFAPNPATSSLKEELYRLCEGTRNGVDADDQTRNEITRIIQKLESTQNTGTAMTKLPLKGSRHTLLYCESEGASSGKIGPFVGDVEQLFAQDEENFINAVNFGPLRISLTATRKVVDDFRIKVKFQETTATAFGIELVTKPTAGGGVWTQRFVDEELRIMETPKLFILRREPQKEITDSPAPTLLDVINKPEEFIFDE